MEAATKERREVEMAESSGIGLDDLMARIDERFDRAEEKTAEGLDRINARIDRVEEKFDERFDRVDEKFVEVGRRLSGVNIRLDQVDHQLVRVNDRLDGQLGRVNDRLDSLVRAMIAAIVTLTGGLAGFAAMIVLIATQL
jgi:hypothetical protein